LNVAEFLLELRQQNVRIRVDSGELRCKAPKGVLTKDLAAEISARKDEIIALLTSAEAEHHELPQPVAFDRTGDLPLSFAQERLWFINHLEPDSSAYNLTASLRFHAAVDLELLQQSLDEIAFRHEILRTTFPARDGQPVQIVGPPAAVPMAMHDLRDRPLDEREQALPGIAREESHQLFDLETGPLFRVRVVLLADEEFVLYISLPHIIADGWSMGTLLEQLAEVYAAKQSGNDEHLPGPKLQYGDFVLWQRSWLQGEKLDGLLDYWKEQVSGAPMMLPLLEQRERPAGVRGNGAVETFSFSAELSERIKTLGKRLRVTDFVTLFSAYAIVLARYSALNTVLIGTPVANRNWLEFEDLIGLFVNTLALRADCDDHLTITEYLQGNQQTLLNSLANQDLPFEKLVEAVNPERTPGVPPIFQATFAFQNTPLSSQYDMISGGSMFDLTLYLYDGQDGFRGSFEYNPDILDSATVSGLIDSLRLVADQLTRDETSRLGELSIVGATQEQALLGDWIDTAVSVDAGPSIAGRFESIVQQFPDASALLAADQRLSYLELNARANRMAHLLMQRGVEPGDRVALCLSRSVEQVVAILATLKAGAIYVPLDPQDPPERLQYLLDDSEPAVVVLDPEPGLEEIGDPARTLRLGDVADELARCPEENPALGVDASQPAYIIYTSGSTGTPKGVLVTNDNVLKLVIGADYIDFGPDEIFLLLAPAYFDASTFELWGGLLHGGCCVVYPERVPSLAMLGAYIRDYGISGLFLTTALFNTIVDTEPDILAPLRWLLFGGEAHSVDHVRRALKSLPETKVSQVYGPTESTTFATAHRLPREWARDQGSVPIGRPIANTTVYVLDERGQVLPPGVTGELYLGGDGVADGYWRRPELSEERFVTLALPRRGDERLYRTGDLVRWRHSGELEFVGRQDFQVKIRGFRVELGEIEATLRDQASVSDAVVLLREDTPGDKHLVAYVVARAVDEVSESEMLQSLAARLPEFMLPSALVIMTEFPLTPNGKVDRSRLPEPSTHLAAESHAKQRPSTSLEVQIAALWEQTLDKRGIGVDENFFDVGGNSLIAVRIFVQIERVTGKKLPLSTLFEAPTIRALARVISADGWEPRWDCLVGIQPLGHRNPIFLVPGIGGNVLQFARLSRVLGNEQPVYGLQSRGLDGKQAPFTRAEDMAAHFIREIQTVRPHGPYVVGGACMGGVVAYEIAQQLRQAGEDVEVVLLIETASPVTLTPGRRRLQSVFHPVVFLMEAAKRHLRAMNGLTLKEKGNYVADKFRIVVEMFQLRDVYRGDRSVMHQDRVSNANYEVMATYRPGNYPGRLHLVLASERRIDPDRDTRMEWCGLADGGSSVSRIDATDSGRLLRDPWVLELASQIRRAISQDSGNDSGTLQKG